MIIYLICLILCLFGLIVCTFFLIRNSKVALLRKNIKNAVNDYIRDCIISDPKNYNFKLSCKPYNEMVSYDKMLYSFKSLNPEKLMSKENYKLIKKYLK